MFNYFNIAIVVFSITLLITGCEKTSQNKSSIGNKKASGKVSKRELANSDENDEIKVLPDDVYTPSPSDLKNPLSVTIDEIEAVLDTNGLAALEVYKNKVLILKSPVVEFLTDPDDLDGNGVLTLVYHRIPIRRRAVIEFPQGHDPDNLIRRVLSLNISPNPIARVSKAKRGIINVQEVHGLIDQIVDLVEVPCQFIEYRGFPVFKYMTHVQLLESDQNKNLPVDFIYGTTSTEDLKKLTVEFKESLTGIRNRGKNRGSMYTLNKGEHDRKCFLRIRTLDLAEILLNVRVLDFLGGVGSICASHPTPEYENFSFNGIDVRSLENLLRRVIDGSQYEMFSKGPGSSFSIESSLSNYHRQIMAKRAQELLDKRIPEKLIKAVDFLLSFYDSEDFYFDLDKEDPRIKVWGE